MVGVAEDVSRLFDTRFDWLHKQRLGNLCHFQRFLRRLRHSSSNRKWSASTLKRAMSEQHLNLCASIVGIGASNSAYLPHAERAVKP